MFPAEIQDTIARWMLAAERSPGYDEVIAFLEYPVLVVVMKRCRGNISKAARALKINRATLRKRLVRHGLYEQ